MRWEKWLQKWGTCQSLKWGRSFAEKDGAMFIDQSGMLDIELIQDLNTANMDTTFDENESTPEIVMLSVRSRIR